MRFTRERPSFSEAVRPSLLTGRELAGILDEVSRRLLLRSDAEITVECNPGTLNREKLEIYKRAGINRLSIGLQSADNRELKTLGRIHTWEQFLENYELVRKIGFRNVNIDLMSALPGQTREDWLSTLEKVTALDPEHISAYSLIIEEGTPFYEKYREDGPEEKELPGEDLDRIMYEDTKAFLHEKGYERYEISNYARPGYECRHNCSYWERVDYKGFGIGAASLLNGVRYQNSTDLQEYLKGHYAYESVEPLSAGDAPGGNHVPGTSGNAGRGPDRYDSEYLRIKDKASDGRGPAGTGRGPHPSDRQGDRYQ